MSPTQNIQVLQDGHLSVEPPLNAVLGACLLVPIEGTGGDRFAADALLEADVVQLVDSYRRVLAVFLEWNRTIRIRLWSVLF